MTHWIYSVNRFKNPSNRIIDSNKFDSNLIGDRYFLEWIDMPTADIMRVSAAFREAWRLLQHNNVETVSRSFCLFYFFVHISVNNVVNMVKTVFATRGNCILKIVGLLYLERWFKYIYNEIFFHLLTNKFSVNTMKKKQHWKHAL